MNTGWEAARQQAEALARERGWLLSKTTFTLRQLQTGSAAKRDEYGYCGTDSEIDHPYFFRETSRPYLPVAILSHSYAPVEECLAYAAAHGLAVEVLPESAYFPGRTHAVLYMTKVPA